MVSEFTCSKAYSENVNLKVWSCFPKKSYVKPWLELFVKEMNNAGKEVGLQVTYVGGPEVFPTLSGAESLQKGIFDIAYTAASYTVGLVPEADAVKLMEMLPWEDRESGAFDLMNAWHNENGLEFLGRVGTGSHFQAYLNVKRTKPDLSGLRMRIVNIYY